MANAAQGAGAQAGAAQGADAGAAAQGGDAAAAAVLGTQQGTDAAAAAAAAQGAAQQQAADTDYSKLKYADGLVVNDAFKAEMIDYAKTNKLSPEAAQKAVDLGAKMTTALAEKHLGEVAALQQTWTAESKADAEFGGDKFDESLGIANKALAQFGNDKLTKVLKDTGLANHPDMIRMFVKIGKLISQDSVAEAISAAASAEKTTAQLLYGGTRQ